VTDDNSKDLKTGHGGDLKMTAESRRIKAVPSIDSNLLVLVMMAGVPMVLL